MTKAEFIALHKDRFVRQEGGRVIIGVISTDNSTVYPILKGESRAGKLLMDPETILARMHKDMVSEHYRNQMRATRLPQYAAPHEIWASKRPVPEDVLADYSELKATPNPPASSEEIETAKKEVHKFTAFEAKNVGTIHLTALTKPTRRLCDWKTILYTSDKWSGTPKNYYHPFKDSHSRSVFITDDEAYIVSIGKCRNTKDGLDDSLLPKEPATLEEAKGVKVWSKLADLLGVDSPCSGCGAILHYDEEKGWVCDKCGPSEGKYQIASGQVLYHGPSKTILCIGKIKA